VISLQSFAVLVHEATCYGSDECMYINTSSDEAENEYEYFRTIIQDLKLLRSTAAKDSKYLLREFEPTQAGYELLAAHNIRPLKEHHE
jgi:hypothetical protein